MRAFSRLPVLASVVHANNRPSPNKRFNLRCTADGSRKGRDINHQDVESGNQNPRVCAVTFIKITTFERHVDYSGRSVNYAE